MYQTASIVPVCYGFHRINATEVLQTCLDDIVQYFPSPAQKEHAGINTKTNEIFEANYDFAKAKSAYVFKTIVDPFIGKYSLIKVCSGVIKNDDTLYNVDKRCRRKTRINCMYLKEANRLKFRNFMQAISVLSQN